MVADGHFQKMPLSEIGTLPLDLWYEWAAQRYCLNKHSKELPSDQVLKPPSLAVYHGLDISESNPSETADNKRTVGVTVSSFAS